MTRFTKQHVVTAVVVTACWSRDDRFVAGTVRRGSRFHRSFAYTIIYYKST